MKTPIPKYKARHHPAFADDENAKEGPHGMARTFQGGVARAGRPYPIAFCTADSNLAYISRPEPANISLTVPCASITTVYGMPLVG